MAKQHGGTRRGAGRKPIEGKRVVTVTVSTGPLKGMSGKEVRAAAEWAVLNGWKKEEK